MQGPQVTSTLKCSKVREVSPALKVPENTRLLWHRISITSKRDKLKERKHNHNSVVGKEMDVNAHLFLTYKVTPRSILEKKTLALPNVGYIHKDSKHKTSALQTK